VTSIRSWGWIPVVLLLVSCLVLTLHFSTTDEEFSRYNIGWTGTSDFFSALDRHTMTDNIGPGDLSQYTNATLLILAPDRGVNAAEGALYRDFVARGNTLLLADDFGDGNTLLEAIGSTIRIRPGTLSSIDRAYTDPALAEVFLVKNTSLLPTGSSLVLNRAATLQGGQPLLASTVFSWVEDTQNRNLSVRPLRSECFHQRHEWSKPPVPGEHYPVPAPDRYLHLPGRARRGTSGTYSFCTIQ